MPLYGTVLIPGANPIVNGTNGKFLYNNNGILGEIDAPGGSPGGADTNIQFNDSGAFGGSDRFNFDRHNVVLNAPFAIQGDGLGDNLILNPTFTGSAANWTLGAGWAYGSNSIVHTPGDTDAVEQSSYPFQIAGGSYQVTVHQSSGTAGRVEIFTGGANLNGIDGADGDTTVTYTGAFPSTTGISLVPTSDYDGTIVEVTVEPIPSMVMSFASIPNPLFPEYGGVYVAFSANNIGPGMVEADFNSGGTTGEYSATMQNHRIKANTAYEKTYEWLFECNPDETSALSLLTRVDNLRIANFDGAVSFTDASGYSFDNTVDATAYSVSGTPGATGTANATNTLTIVNGIITVIA